MQRDQHHEDEPAGQHGMDLPELPIPRPAGRREGAPDDGHPPIGGGASLTAAIPHEPAPARTTPSPHPAPAPGTSSADEQRDAERFTWEIAAQLTAGMLANPARTHTSVKDAMAMFDQFLHEMDAYARLKSNLPLDPSTAPRRQAHGEYFFQPAAAPEGQTGSGPAPASAPAPAPPAPQRPRPLGGFEAMPRLPYQRPTGDDRAA